MKTEKLRSFLINLGLLFGSVVVVFAIGEVVTRVMYRDTMTLFPRYHSSARYGDFTLRTIRPNSTFWHTSPDGSWEFRTNAQGFRNDQDFPYDKLPGVIRVLTLGDSHTQGYEARQEFTYSAVIEKHLRLHGWNAEVINAGVSGFSTAEALLFLENEGIKYQPDAVVLGFFGNDYQDNIKSGLFRLQENGELVIEKHDHTPGVKVQNFIYRLPFVKWLGENSYFYSAVFNAVWIQGKRALARDAAEQVAEYAIATDEPVTAYQFALTEALLARLYRFCHEREIPLILIDLPETATETIDPSIDSETLQHIDQYSDAFVSSVALLTPYAGVTEIHRPRGQVHISEFTHTILGVAAAEAIERLLAPAQ
jgi:ABC-type antimicrobial peptide transport system permease subunit